MLLTSLIFSAIQLARSMQKGAIRRLKLEKVTFFQLQAMRLVLAAVRDSTRRAWSQLLLLATQQVGVDRAAIVRPDGTVIVVVGDNTVRVGDRIEIPEALRDLEYGFAIHPTPGVGWDAAVPLWDGDDLIGVFLLDDTSSERDFSDEESHLLSMYADVLAGVLALHDPLHMSAAALPSREAIMRAVNADAVESATVVVQALPAIQPERVTNSTPLPLPGQGMIQRAMEQIAMAAVPWTCLMVGLRGMRVVNALGRDHGDVLLRKAANALRSLVPQAVLLGRYRGDVFLIAGTWEQMESLTPVCVETHLREQNIHAVAAWHRTDGTDIRFAQADNMLGALASASLNSAMEAMLKEKRARVGVDSQRTAR